MQVTELKTFPCRSFSGAFELNFGQHALILRYLNEAVLITVISKLVKRGYQSHLQDFLLRLNFNDYYRDT